MTYYSHFVHDRLSSSRFSGGRNRAEKEPIPNRGSLRTKGSSSKLSRDNIRHRIEMFSAPRSSSTPRRACAMTRSPRAWTRPDRSSPSGASASSKNASPDWKNSPEADGPSAFPPSVVIAVKALACEPPSDSGLPLSRFSIPELRREILSRGLVASIGESTLWRWLAEDAIRPWCHRSWIFPRDPAFEERAGRILDLYQGVWEGRPLTDSQGLRDLD